MRPLSLYIHVPFCDGKCPYCDFYSLSPSRELAEGYMRRIKSLMAQYEGTIGPLGTVYFGGGTPSLMGAGMLGELLEEARRRFGLPPEAEITCEANPTGLDAGFFRELRAAGFNRLSMGMQSADPAQLSLLGRRHSPEDVGRAVSAARAAGFENVSLDIMLALPGGSVETLGKTARFAASLGVEHISAYILKIEAGTPFAARGLATPEDDEAAEQYLYLVDELAKLGYKQYEISNFSLPGYESRHNLCYWRCREYLGLGPGAHSFMGGRRSFFPRDLAGFIGGDAPIDDGPGGDPEEFAMLNLRLSRGLLRGECLERFGPEGESLFREIAGRVNKCPPGLVNASEEAVSFTPEGFLVSNALLAQLLG